jgi:hypothetical protein
MGEGMDITNPDLVMVCDMPGYEDRFLAELILAPEGWPFVVVSVDDHPLVVPVSRIELIN